MRRDEPGPTVLLLGFTVAAFALAFPDVTRLRTFVAGDSGDSLLNLWIMRAVQHGVPHGWNAMWNAPIFSPAHSTLAYSDTLFPVALVHWPLRLLLGDVLAFNAVYLSAFVISSWCMYRLGMRYIDDGRVAAIGALTYTYAPIILVHHGHFQLVVGSALVSVVLLVLVRCLDAPSTMRGAAVGVSLAALGMTSSYFGAMMSVLIAVVVAGWLLATRPLAWKTHLRSFIVAAAVATALAGPFAYKYVQLQTHPEFRRGFEAQSAAHFDDFLATTPRSYLLTHIPVVGPHSLHLPRGIENRLFPGLVAVVFGAVGVLLALATIRSGAHSRRHELLLIGLGGLACVVLAFGDRFVFAHRRIPLPFIVFRHFVPGFAGIRATARFALGGQLALALFAAVGLQEMVRRLSPILRSVAIILVGSTVVATAAIGLTMVRVPIGRDDGGIARALKRQPRGVVLELPIASVASGVPWPYIEAPRQVEALNDGRPRVNGYSGFQPKDFDALAARLNQFPSRQALAEAHRLDVRYVVLRTRLVGTLTPSTLVPSLARDGIGRYTDATARGMIAHLPEDVVAVESLPGGYIVELRR